MTRRKMLEISAAAALGTLLTGCAGGEVSSPTVPSEKTPAQQVTSEKVAETITPTGPSAGQAYMAVARGADPVAITEAAVKALGGIERFVKKGADVIIKPNICTDYYTFEYGATTNPEVVATLVRLALGAGAGRVRIMDVPFGGSAQSAYVKSGISDAVKAAGGEMELMNRNKYRMTKIPDGKSIKEWGIYQDVLNCDLLIDVPIAKHHGLAQMTAAEKNLMGVIQQRSSIHAEMGQRIPDLVSVIRPGLIVVDAFRTLMTNGPSGGNLDDVKLNNTVFATHDIVAADAFAATFFGLTGNDIPYIKNAAAMGLGTLDLTSIKVEEINV
jgi:uncharacterized protein (DUF362 family)